MLHKTIYIAVALLMSPLLASCSVPQKDTGPPLERQLIGRWRQINGPTTLEFFKRGTVVIADNETAMSAYFEFVGDKSVKIEPKFRSVPMKSDSRLWMISIRGDLLTIVEGEQRTRFRRQR